MSNTPSWQVSAVYSAVLLGDTMFSVCLWSTAPFLCRLLWQLKLTLWPSFTNFSILCYLGRAPKCHCFLKHCAKLLPRHKINREIVSVLLVAALTYMRIAQLHLSISFQRWNTQTYFSHPNRQDTDQLCRQVWSTLFQTFSTSALWNIEVKSASLWPHWKLQRPPLITFFI